MTAFERLFKMPNTTSGRLLLAAAVCTLAAIGALGLIADDASEIIMAPLSLLDAPPAIPAEEVSSGTHWAEVREFQTLKDLGHEWVIQTVHPE